MKRLALLLALSTACTTRRQSVIAMGVGAGMFAGGALLLHGMSGDDDPPPVLGLAAVALALGGAGTFVFSGINAIDTPWTEDLTPRLKYDVAGYDACTSRRRADVSAGCGVPPTAAERAAQRDAVRERAWLITRAIASAARSGDCAAVRRADGDVAALDPEFHATVFVRDAAIARCLGR